MGRTLELSPRLRMAADLVPDGARVADIGTDHAYLPAALLLEGRCDRAICCDVNAGPLDRARQTAREYGLERAMEFRLSDGLAGLRPGEADAAVIAGMGGETIAGILERSPWVLEENIPLILQPMSTFPELRLWLREHGWRIEREDLAREGGTIYCALLVRPGEMPPLTPAQLRVGLNYRHPLRRDWLELWRTRTERALSGLGRARQQDISRRQELEEVRRGLLEMEEELIS